jgi:hypothetical protein
MIPPRPTCAKLVPLLSIVLVAFAGAHARADAPAQRYELRASGLVAYDVRTKLSWQRATAPSTYRTLADAKSYCSQLDLNGSGFRVPTLRELATIVDTNRTYPAIDPTAFPNTSNELYWSATVTRDATNPPNYWGMFFDVGSTRMITEDTSTVPPPPGEHVRCVR